MVYSDLEGESQTQIPSSIQTGDITVSLLFVTTSSGNMPPIPRHIRGLFRDNSLQHF